MFLAETKETENKNRFVDYFETSEHFSGRKKNEES